MSTSRSKHPEGRSRQARQDQPESSTSRHSAELIAQQTTIEAHQGPLPTPGAGLAGGVILSIVGVLYVKQRYAKQVPLSGKTAEK